MRVITWNCRHSFTKEKIAYINQYKPDILVIQECIQENIAACNEVWTNCEWYGDHLEYNNHKKGDLGVGLFSSTYSFSISPLHNKNIRYVVPYNISSDKEEFVLFSTWTKADGCKTPYIGQINEALENTDYQPLLRQSIFIGDFNANKIWDIKENVDTFEKAVGKFSSLNMKSAYHSFKKEVYGQEKQVTSHQTKGKFHIDYCFVPNYMDIKNIEIKEFGNEILSDHLPLIIDFEF